MKRRTILVFGLVLVILLSFGSGVVLSQTSKELPRVTTVCETKAGLIHGFDDGFSILKKCPMGSRKIVVGEKPNTGTGIDLNDVLFVGGVTLLKDGNVLEFIPDYINNKYYWQKTERKVPVDPLEIVQWSGSNQENFFVTKDGSIYAWTQISDGANGWVKTER